MRRAAYELARSMDADIDYASLKGQIAEERPELAEFLRRENPSRPNAKGDWEALVNRRLIQASTGEHNPRAPPRPFALVS